MLYKPRKSRQKFCENLRVKIYALEKIDSKERKQEEITRDVSGAASCGRGNQHIFVAGGSLKDSVEIFNYPQKLWSLLKPMPHYRERASSFVYDNHVTLAGGRCVRVVVSSR